jgi:hypothetical protein
MAAALSVYTLQAIKTEAKSLPYDASPSCDTPIRELAATNFQFYGINFH